MLSMILEVNKKMDDDHNYSSNNKCMEYILVENVESSSANIVIEEKEGDDFLIELYRERIYLYDKSHRDFKNKIIKENAWVSGNFQYHATKKPR